MMINWKYYPTYNRCPKHLESIVKVFENNENIIIEAIERIGEESSNAVLEIIRADLENLDNSEFQVEITSNGQNKLREIGFPVNEKSQTVIITRPVLYGDRGKEEKSYKVDAYCEKNHTIVIAVRNIARKGKKSSSCDFEEITKELNALYASDRLSLPLRGLMIIGY